MVEAAECNTRHLMMQMEPVVTKLLGKEAWETLRETLSSGALLAVAEDAAGDLDKEEGETVEGDYVDDEIEEGYPNEGGDEYEVDGNESEEENKEAEE